MPSAVDVGPSGFSFPTGGDLDTTTFPDTGLIVVSYVLNDGETGTLHETRCHQYVRGGHTITIDATSSDPDRRGDRIARHLRRRSSLLPVTTAARSTSTASAGTTTLGIDQPAGHTDPADKYLTRTVNVTAPDVWLTYLMQQQRAVSVPVRGRVRSSSPVQGPAGGSAASTGGRHRFSPRGVGRAVVGLPHRGRFGHLDRGHCPHHHSLTPTFYVQGLIEGDNTDDDVPITIDVVETGTANSVGYEQADMPSAVDVGPSGFAFPTGGDLTPPRSRRTRSSSSTATC